MLYDILTIIYLVILAIIGIMVVWNVFETSKLSVKITGAVFLILLILRLFLLK